MKLRDTHWSVYFLVWLAGIAGAGAVLGAGAFLLGGALLQKEPNYAALALEGARRVGFIFTIWAPGIGLAACVMRGYRRKQAADVAVKTTAPASAAERSEP